MTEFTDQKNKARDEFMVKAAETFTTGVKFKQLMLKKGIMKARVPCPRCGKWLHMQLDPYNKHARMWCDTAGCMTMME